jgi:hypothetical protein
LEVLVDENFTNGRVREMVIERYLREVLSTYFRRFPFSMLFETTKYLIGHKKLISSLAQLLRQRSVAPLLKKHICQALLAQNFVLPTVEAGVISSRLEGQITS